MDILRRLHANVLLRMMFLVDFPDSRLDAVVRELALLVDGRVRLSDGGLLLLVCGKIHDLVGHVGANVDSLLGYLGYLSANSLRDDSAGVQDRPAPLVDEGLPDGASFQVGICARNILAHLPIRRLDEAVGIRPRIRGQRSEQADVRAFWRFYRADASVVRLMDVPHFEPCTVSGQAARSKRGQPALVRQLRQRVRLIHELRELRPSEELSHRSNDRPDVD